MNVNHLFLLFLFFTLQPLRGQYTLTGSLFADGSPLAYAEISLRDSLEQLVTGAYTDDEGRFSLRAAAGNYVLHANYLGYAPFSRSLRINEDIDLGALPLETGGTELATVKVTARRRLVEQKADRLVFHVENSVAAAGGDALAALQLAPGVRLQNGLLELIGRGNPVVLINNRPLQLTGEELMAYLGGLAADDIARIEVIPNPPARYAAAGQGGLLNVVLKSGRADSWKNTTALGRTQAYYGSTRLSNSFSYNRNRTSLSANLTGTSGFQRDLESVDVLFPAGAWRTQLVSKSQRDNLTGRLALDYEFSPRFSLGGQYLGNFGEPNSFGASRTLIGRPDSLFDSTQDGLREVTSHTANLHGRWALDTNGRTLSFDLDLFDYDNELDQTNVIRTFGPEGDLRGTNLAQQNLSAQRIDNRSVRVDVEHPLGAVKLDYGFALNYTETFGDQRSFNVGTGPATFDSLLSNEFLYEENIQAAYLNASGSFGEKWNWQAGLRGENTQTESYSVTLDQRTPNDYFRLFPTLFLSHRPNDDHDFSFSYGRRINRPGFRNLNPFRLYINSNSYSEGNPFLQPSFTDRFEFTHGYKGWLRSNLFFNRTLDGHGTVFSQDPETQVQAVLRRNYFVDYYFGIGESITLEAGRWSSQSQVWCYGSVTDVLPGFDVISRNGVQLNLSSNHTFSLGEGTKLQANAWYNAPHQANVFEIAATYGLTLGVQQKIGRNLELSLLANDVFDTGSLRSLASVVNGVRTVYGSNYANRFVRLRVQYRFGNDKIQVRERAFGNEGVRRRS